MKQYLTAIKIAIILGIVGVIAFLFIQNKSMKADISTLNNQLSGISTAMKEQNEQIKIISETTEKALNQKQSNTKQSEEVQNAIKKSLAKDKAGNVPIPSDVADQLRKQIDSIRSSEASSN